MKVDPEDPEVNMYLLDVVTHHQPPISTAENCCLKVLMAQEAAERKQTLQDSTAKTLLCDHNLEHDLKHEKNLTI